MTNIIRAGTITSLLRSVLDPSGQRQIDWEAPASEYIVGENGAPSAFANALNRSPQFSGYGLSLGPNDLADADKLRDIVEAIIGWFQRRGWQVVL